MIKILKNDGVELPTFATPGSVGFDLKGISLLKVFNGIKEIPLERFQRSLDQGFFILRPFERALVGTGIKMELPPELWVKIQPKSGNSLKKGILVYEGTIDSDYRGEVGIVIQNSSNYMMRIDLGTYLAQGVLYHSIQDQFVWADELSDSERGEGGFGSTGRNAADIGAKVHEEVAKQLDDHSTDMDIVQPLLDNYGE